MADDVRARVCRRDPEMVMRLGGRVDHLPRGGPAAKTDDVAAARHDMRRLAEAMPQESDRILAAFLRDQHLPRAGFGC
ncbi:MAG TPA: hypothetical protein VGP26_08185 [Actinophytocola sp.]|nr:hypothetical protein [Actinophytocola sp.]